jgi:hypothetical protein
MTTRAPGRPRRLQFWCPGGTYFGELSATVAGSTEEYSRSCRNPDCRVAGKLVVHYWRLSDPRQCRTEEVDIESNEQVKTLLAGE